MKFGVITFPGSHSDEDMALGIERLSGRRTERLWHTANDLQGCDLVILPGGAAFGDHLRAGAIAARSPIMAKVAEHARQGGLVLGVGNGFQILCEAGLLPGTLLPNAQGGFISRHQWIRPASLNTLLTAGLRDAPLRLPVAHASGRYHADGKTLKLLNEKDLVLFHYCDHEGRLRAECNPDGSVENIAGVCNEGRNVFGLMAHPERAASPLMGNTDGRLLLDSLLQTAPV